MKHHFDRLYSDTHWGSLEVLVTDHSPIDLGRLAIVDQEDAFGFVRSYGYDLHVHEDAAEVDKIRREALNFIQRQFLDNLGPEYRPLKIPRTLYEAGIIELLMLASSSPRAHLQKWACAVLRVMHTLAHVVTDLSSHFFPDIQDQVLGPYYRHLHREDGQLWLGEDEEVRLPLVDFQAKVGKERDSAVLKLLHKPENVAADIFDRIGVRFVTRDRLDAVLVLRYLREQNLVTFPNVKPSRSVNTLIALKQFRKRFRELYQLFERGAITYDTFEETLRHDAQFNDTLTRRQIRYLFNRNQFTSRQYRSMQFTVRQLVRLNNPLYPFRERLDMANETDPWLKAQYELARPYYRFFFPYEIQIVDAETHANNVSGQASHEVYKRRQVLAARERVLGTLLRRFPVPAAEASDAK